MKTLALFDLDNTLLIGDSDHAWGKFLAEVGAVDAKTQLEKQDYFYQQYVAGELDIYEFTEFQFTALKENSLDQLKIWREEYVETHILPLVTQARIDLVDWHQQQQHETIIITATNSFITEPIAKIFNIEHLIATEPEQNIHGFTGKLTGTPCFQAGKISRLNDYINNQLSNGLSIKDFDTWFYSDSINDLPLLEIANHPIAVTPDDKLRQFSIEQNWKIID